MLRNKPSASPDLQAAADAAAWKLLLRRRPDVAERIRGALAAGRGAEQVLAAASHPEYGLAAWPRLRLLLPCAIYGCSLDLAREQRERAPRRGFALLRAVHKITA